jgi:glycosyltransferase involved in cell wall biosynthesis
VERIGDPRIRVVRNDRNLGYSLNLRRCMEMARNDIVMLMGQDDLVCDGYLQRVHDIFAEHPNVGAITRAYFWFHDDPGRAVRYKDPVNPSGDVVLSLETADPEMIFRAFHSMDQLSCLAMRREWIEQPVHEHIFTAHVYPMASVWKNRELYCIHDPVLAVRIESSQSRSVSGIYDPSPMQTWAQMFETVFPEPRFNVLRRRCIRDFVAKNYVGLVQIRNFGRYSWLLREIGCLLKYRPLNIFNPQFWFFSLGCVILPPALLIRMVDTYKRRVLSKAIGPVRFQYSG